MPDKKYSSKAKGKTKIASAAHIKKLRVEKELFLFFSKE
jgi:hypothetical protein